LTYSDFLIYYIENGAYFQQNIFSIKVREKKKLSFRGQIFFADERQTLTRFSESKFQRTLSFMRKVLISAKIDEC